ncbi:MAG: sporulation protein YtfJ [Litoreibacter sp.]|nr:sporulation protein YtfJ [Litoreibacter sp.]
MKDVEELMKGTVAELDNLLNARNVLGDPIERDGAMVIPIVSYGFGFGAGGSTGGKTDTSGGTGGGGGIKPLGAIIIDQKGARVEGIKSATTILAEALADKAAEALERSNKSRRKSDKTA